MPKNPYYTCICCGYETDLKSNMYRHLYLKKKPCPKTKNNIEFTDEIKDHIMINRIYIIPIEEKPAVINITNNTMNNYIIKMDPFDKLTKFNDYNDVKLIDFKIDVEKKFLDRANKLNNIHRRQGFSEDQLLDHIDEVCKVCDIKTFQDFNLLYNKKLNEVKIYEYDKWNEHIIERGICKILQIIQECLWDKYEFYMIRKRISENLYQKQVIKEQLDKYYGFIVHFDVKPNIITYFEDDDDIEDIDENDIDIYNVKDEYIKIYNDVNKEKNKKVGNVLKKKIIDILEYNMKKNIDEMNKKISNLFTKDKDFKEFILE